MFLFKSSLKKYLTVITALLLAVPVWAAGPPSENPLYNPMAILLFSVMIILLFAIGILGSILTGAGDIFLIKRKQKNAAEKSLLAGKATAIFIVFALISSAVCGQESPAITKAQPISNIGGLTPSVFYLMVSIIFLELLVILVLLINVRLLIKSQKEKLVVAAVEEKVAKAKGISWWSRFNKLKPMEQEADLDLGHDYDGIRELNNRLPPWWVYGFYITIIFAAVYLWRYHVSHTAPLSIEEYEISVRKADKEVKEYLEKKGETVDENSVVMLGVPDIEEGKKIFEASCISCHKEGGAGFVGPNLTDDYWLHGGDIKSVFKTIKYGFNAMPTWQNSYSNKQIAQLASYVKSLKGTNPPDGKPSQGELYKDDISSPKASIDSSTVKKDGKVATR